MEIERKFTIKELPSNLEQFDKHEMIQAYLCDNPVVRIRKQDDAYYMTYKGRGFMTRDEYNHPLTKEGFEHMLEKADGTIIEKTRYLIPLKNPRFTNGYTFDEDSSLTVELDIFHGAMAPLILAEVEFPDVSCAEGYIMEDWFLEDVTEDKRYHNSNMVYTGINPAL